MISGVVRAAGFTAVAALALAGLLAPRGHRPLDPRDPIAADGSMIAGRAQTIFDTERAYGAFGAPPHADPDDPKDFEWRIKNDRPANDRTRQTIAKFIGPLDRNLCWNGARLTEAVREYYGARSREKYSFSLRGPRATAAMAKEWSTPLDKRIDEFVRAALLSGYLHKVAIPANVYPEFAKVFAETDEGGTTCLTGKAGAD